MLQTTCTRRNGSDARAREHLNQQRAKPTCTPISATTAPSRIAAAQRARRRGRIVSLLCLLHTAAAYAQQRCVLHSTATSQHDCQTSGRGFSYGFPRVGESESSGGDVGPGSCFSCGALSLRRWVSWWIPPRTAPFMSVTGSRRIVERI